ncbi:MAG: SUMF1/EgtB/PvdO family nonheme iron enzyme [Magnetococcales bacterium]|nr:SUMF1/EgtB/PvdO family nonheme iron enzyme [Magnetococcales bacterium]
MSRKGILYCIVLAVSFMVGLPEVATAQRRALVIGNNDYLHVKTLERAVPDAETMTEKFRKAGFTVSKPLTNRTHLQMHADLLAFVKEIDKDDEVVFFYAGHGVKVGQESFLLPIDIPHPDELPNDEKLVAVKSLPLETVLKEIGLKQGKVNVVILDACRDNPLQTRFGRVYGDDQGLAPPPRDVRGTLVIYSARAGTKALDKLNPRDGDPNGLFVRVAREEMFRPGVRLLDAMERIGERLRELTGGKQESAFYAEGGSRFCFLPTELIPPPSTGTLRLSSEPGGASVEVDGKDRGVVTVVEGLTVGEHTVVLRKGECGLFQSSVAIKGGETVELRAKLTGTDNVKHQGTCLTVAERDRRQGEADTAQRKKRIEECFSNPEPRKECVEPVTGMAFVWVPAGSFMMGQSEKEKKYLREKYSEEYEKNYSDEQKDGGPFDVRIEQGFWLGRYEVTVGQFRSFVEATGYETEAERDVGEKGCYAWAKGEGWKWREGVNWRMPGFAQGDDHPVVCVSWNDAQKYVGWLNQGKGGLYRLPTEAEWEYAARGGTKTIRYWGDDVEEKEACQYANVADRTTYEGNSFTKNFSCNDGYWFTAPVHDGKRKPNPFGLNDMLGNVWEWTCSWHGSYSDSEKKYAKCDGGGSGRVVRGGGWDGIPALVRSALRSGDVPDDRSYDLGFRLSRTNP